MKMDDLIEALTFGKSDDEIIKDGVEAFLLEQFGIEPSQPTMTRFSVTGESYVVITSHGLKDEGVPPPESYLIHTHSMVWARFLSHILNYLIDLDAGNEHKLYWRSFPTIRRDERNSLYIRARFLISDKPVKEVE